MELRLKGMISEGRLRVEIPSGTPDGDVEVAVSPSAPVDIEKRNRELLAWLDELHADPNRRTRTREEIDADLKAERDSWD